MTDRYWVVFCATTQLRWLRILKAGFRHCFVVRHDGRHWITIDPLAGFLDVAVQPVAASRDLIAWYRSQGHCAVAAQADRPAPSRARSPTTHLAPLTCVSVCKRVLGLHDWRIVTPFQLYRHLCRAAARQPAA